MLAFCYKLLLDVQEGNKLLFRIHWESDFGLNFTYGLWARIVSAVGTSSINNRDQEQAYKILTRWYRIPQFIHKINPEKTNLCWRCQEEGDMFHIFRSCVNLRIT